MAWFPGAVQVDIGRKKVAMRTPRRINLHTAVSDTKSLGGYWRTNKLGVFSHFYVREDGAVEQYQDTQYRSSCDLEGNPDTISVESWDGYGRVWTGHAGATKPPAWNPKQVAALVRLVRWIFDTHPSIPKKRALSNLRGSESFGLSYHQLGSPGLMEHSSPAGLKYTNARGKVCPGAQRIAQIPGIFASATKVAPPSGGGSTTPPGFPSTGDGPSSKPTAPKPIVPKEELSMSDIKAIMARLDEIDKAVAAHGANTVLKVRDVQKVGFDRAGVTAISKAVRGELVRRGAGYVDWIQDTADGTTNTNILCGQVEAVLEMLSQVMTLVGSQPGADLSGFDISAVVEAAKAGAHQGVASGGKELAGILATELGDLLADHARELDEETQERIVNATIEKVGERLATPQHKAPGLPSVGN